MSRLNRRGESRRAILRGAAGLGAGLGLLHAAGARAQAGAQAGLNAAARRAGLVFGAASEIDIGTAPEAYGALYARHCGLFAPNLGWRRVAPTPDDAEPAWEDPNIAFALGRGMRLTGGHFLWDRNTPAWFADVPRGTAQAEIDRHILQLGRHYAGSVFAWNVINEEIDVKDGGPDGLRRSVFRDKLGTGYMAAAFRAARVADPHARLLYNDNDLEMPTRYQQAKRDALMRILDIVQRAGAPIDGVGLQTHMRADGSRFDAALYARFLHDVAARGLIIFISEMDVVDQRAGTDFALRDADVAARYGDFLAVAFDQVAVKALVTWGLSDYATWLTPERAMRYGRHDDLPTRPLPFDDNFRPKPAYDAIYRAIVRAPKRVPC